MAYQSFVPSPLPPVPPVGMTGDMVAHLVRAHSGLAVLDSVARRTPNADVFVPMLVRKEALMSSQIEGTQATLEDILDPLLAANSNRTVADVVHYIKATEFAVKRLKELPLCTRLIKEAHAVLMEGVRGQEKSPGEFRHSQNWIGGQRSTLRNARYIPPSPDDMTEAMSCLKSTSIPMTKPATILMSWSGPHWFTTSLKRSILFWMATAGWDACLLPCSSWKKGC